MDLPEIEYTRCDDLQSLTRPWVGPAISFSVPMFSNLVFPVGEGGLARHVRRLRQLCPADHPARCSAQDRAVRCGGRVSRSRHPIKRKEPDVAGKKRPKSLAQTEKKAPAKGKRPKKTSRGK